MPFVLLWLGIELRKPAMNKKLMWALLGIAIVLALASVTAGIVEDQKARRKQARVRAEWTERHAQLLDKINKAEALGKAIPKGCPKGVDAEPWNAKVEALRKEASDALGEAFAKDKSDYPHACPLEWVRNRLDHFLIRWQAAALALKP